MNKKHQLNIWYWIWAFLILMLFQSWWQGVSVTERIPYSRFIELLEQDRIAAVQVQTERVIGRYREPIDGRTNFVTNIVPEDLTRRLEQSSAEYDGTVTNTFLTQILSWVVPILLIFGLWMFVFRKIAEKQGFGGMMTVGKSKAKVYVEKDTGVTFDDVAGIDEARQELEEIVSFLKEPDRYGRLGARIPKGILLVGPPGTGKTLVARAVAGEAGVPFFSISGSEFVEMFVGVGAARVRDLFEQARKAVPCIIFIDELDALGKKRGIGAFGGGHDEKEQTLNQLLTELDGFDPREGIVLLAATNRPEILDPALLRAGRFDRQVVVDRPDKRGRAAILRVHLRKVQHRGLDVDQIAGLTPGFSGAELANLVNEAAIQATRRGAEAVEMEDVTAAIERIVAGLERKGRLLNPKEREAVAWHEMGHALAAASLPGADPVHKVSIIPRTIGALGYTMQRPTEDRFLITRSDLENRMVVLLAGRAAEDLVLGEISTGAADDLARVTDIARQIVTRFGMHPDLGQAVLEAQRPSFLGEDGAPSLSPRDYSEATAREVDLAVRDLIARAYERARQVLTERRADLEAGTRLLLERETITPEDFPALRPVAQAAQ
ncbi:MAG: ATP-dependent metallopeptidase FtsH/Yme1/Tma family protein [Roseovarius sp.]|nr:ATP-dependent metallopeptidase FtsH/Yme1/Tma family protein [Roseovarius sp.]